MHNPHYVDIMVNLCARFARDGSTTQQAREKAKLAAFLAKKYPETSKLAATIAAAASGGGGNSSAADAADVQFVGERTREERDAELREAAIDVEG